MTTATLKCCYCKARFPREEAHCLPVGNFCTYTHVIAYAAEKGAQKLHKQRKDEHRNRRAAFKAADTSTLAKTAQAAVNKLCKLLDAGKPCISCGRPDEGGRKRNAGHFKSRGANSAIRYSLINLHSQCVVCNLYQSGNIAGYIEGIRARFGQASLDYLETAPRLRQWTAIELAQIAADARAECRQIEKGTPPSRDWRALPEQQGREVA